MNTERSLSDQERRRELLSLIPQNIRGYLVTKDVIPALVRTRSGTWDIPVQNQTFGFAGVSDLKGKLDNLQEAWKGYVKVTVGEADSSGLLKVTFVLLK